MKATCGAWLALGGLAATALAEPAGRFEPIKVTPTTEIVYPHRMVEKFIDRGEVRIMVLVDGQGRLADWMVTGYSHPLFAKEALDSLQKWKYEPARLHGQPITYRDEVRFRFSNKGIVRVIPGDMEFSLRMKETPYAQPFQQHIYRAEELDRIPDTVVEIAPMQPDRLGARAAEGQVSVDYLIDLEGRVRMPLILSSDDDAFTQAVLLALSDWRYETPKRNGTPVVARVARRFDFRPAQVAADTSGAWRKPDQG